jgi:hypothetical protein
VIELSNAFEPGRKCNLGHRELRLVDELPCKVDAMGGRNLERGRTKMLHEKAAQLARTKPHSSSQPLYVSIIQSTFQNQPESAVYYR